MAIAIEKILSSVQSLCENDDEMRSIYVHLNQLPDIRINEALQLMILISEVKKRMGEDIVHFTYKKKDGTLRQAYGTRASDVIVRHEGAMLPSSQNRPRPNSGTFAYYDIERMGWRCFKAESLMDIDRGYTI